MNESVASPQRAAFETMTRYLKDYLASVGAKNTDKRLLEVICSTDEYGCYRDGNHKPAPKINIPNPHFVETKSETVVYVPDLTPAS